MGDTKEFIEDLVKQAKGMKPVVQVKGSDVVGYRSENGDGMEAYRKAQLEKGNPVAQVMDKSDGLPPIVRGSEFPQQYELVKRKPLVDGLFRVGDNVLLSGPPKMGKSWFYSTLALCLAEGRPFLGQETAKCNVMMVDLELHRDDAQDRLWSIAYTMDMKTIPNDLYLWSLRSAEYDLDSFCEILRARLASMPKMDAVFIDPIYLLEGDGDFDENSNSAVTALLRELQQIVKETGSALLLAHHYRKGNMGRENHMDRTSGAGAFNRFPDSMMTLSYHMEPQHAILEVTGRSMPHLKPIICSIKPPAITRVDDLPIEHRRWK